jgi:hypothetical protein
VSVVDLVLDALASYRLTRFVTADVLTQDARDQWILATYVAAGRNEWAHAQIGDDPAPGAWQALVESDDRAPKLAVLVTCRWCAGFWISASIVLVRAIAPRLWRPLARALAFSAGAALLSRMETDE